MDAYIKQMLSYLGYITDTYHWQITIHDFHHITGRLHRSLPHIIYIVIRSASS